MQVRELLKNGTVKLTEYKIEDAILKVRMLLLYELQIQNEYLAVHLEEEASLEIAQNFEKHLEELIAGKPIQYITNSQEFFGLDFYIDENVLIPQPDTEILVEEIIEICKYREDAPKILDICTGSGAIAVTLAKQIKVEMVASDISSKALEIAEKNAKRHGVNIELTQSDMFEKINQKFDMIVSNPPYIETKTIESLSPEVKNEPQIALDGGEDGLKFYRVLAQKAKDYLKENGVLAVEIGYNQRESVLEIFRNAGFCDIYAKQDLAGKDRIVVGKWR